MACRKQWRKNPYQLWKEWFEIPCPAGIPHSENEEKPLLQGDIQSYDTRNHRQLQEEKFSGSLCKFKRINSVIPFFFFSTFGLLIFFPSNFFISSLGYSLFAWWCVYVWLPWFLRGQTQKENLSQGIRLVISRVVTFISATQTSAVLDERLIAEIVCHC